METMDVKGFEIALKHIVSVGPVHCQNLNGGNMYNCAMILVTGDVHWISDPEQDKLESQRKSLIERMKIA